MNKAFQFIRASYQFASKEENLFCRIVEQGMLTVGLLVIPIGIVAFVLLIKNTLMMVLDAYWQLAFFALVAVSIIVGLGGLVELIPHVGRK